MSLENSSQSLSELLKLDTAQKVKFSIQDFISKCDQIRTADLDTFTEEVLNRKLHLLCSENSNLHQSKVPSLMEVECLFLFGESYVSILYRNPRYIKSFESLI